MLSILRTTLAAASLIALLAPFAACGQSEPLPWTPEQLMQPAELAARIADAEVPPPVIYDIGPVGGIPGSIHIGPGTEEENLAKLRTELSRLPQDAEVVIYCGCCPYDRCPNVRPTFKTLQALGFVNGKLLDLPENLKQDWIDKGYPVE